MVSLVKPGMISETDTGLKFCRNTAILDGENVRDLRSHTGLMLNKQKNKHFKPLYEILKLL